MKTHAWLKEREYLEYLRAFGRSEGPPPRQVASGDLTRLLAHAAQAMRSGNCKVLGPGVFRWDAAGRCTGDVWVHRIGEYRVPKVPRHDLDAAFIVGLSVERAVQISLNQRVPCRKCPECLRARAARWRNAARREIAASARTWFLTLTFHPDFHNWCEDSFRFPPYSERDCEAELWLWRMRNVSRVTTLFLKRIRKNSGASLRYLLVVEKHKSGRPHLHALFHEGVSGSITWRHVDQAWGQGFHKTVLVDKTKPSPAAYVTKYLTKSLEARVRASQRYGALP